MPSRQDANTAGTSAIIPLRLEQLVALGVGLHQAVLDAVVDHLGVVAGADPAGVDEAGLPLRLEGLEGTGSTRA